MRAVECQGGKLDVVEVAPLRSGAGQLVLEVQRCGICGSNPHAKDHADGLDDVMADVGHREFMRSNTPVVMGHEFCGAVAERGRGVAKEFKVGDVAALTEPMAVALHAVRQ
jgi:threonine dehydrogenase-like Zn-dependent dehydrogenase